MVQKLKATLDAYVATKIELYKIDVEVALKKMALKVIFYFAVAILGFLALSFLLLGLAQLINQYLHSTYAGYFIFAFICVGLLAFLIIFKNTCLRFFVRLVK